MLPQKAKWQSDELSRRLPSHGWNVAEIEQPFEDEWWAAEFWVIESAWSPQGVQVYLTFLVDPMGGREDIWAIHASRHRPRQQPVDDDPQVCLGHGWQEDLQGFIERLNQLRVKSPQK